MQKDLSKGIKSWLKLAYKITRSRDKEGYTNFLNINPLNVLDKKTKRNLLQRILSKSNQTQLAEAFLISFIAFCNSVNDRAEELSKSKDRQVKDDLLSLDEIIMLLDRGFDILLSIQQDIFKNVVKDAHVSYIQAIQTIFAKRLSIREYLSIDIQNP